MIVKVQKRYIECNLHESALRVKDKPSSIHLVTGIIE